MSFLQIEASAARTERIFSAASLIQPAVRNRLDPEMLEILVFVKKNKIFILKVEEVKAGYWRRRALKKVPKKRKEPEVAAAAAAAAQESVLEDQVEDVDEVAARRMSFATRLMTVKECPAFRSHLKNLVANLNSLNSQFFSCDCPRAILQIPIGLFR
jgi:hypothetical protein